uniref:SFRICE_037881 n=1 Tax=Spodoptera frugiperda TaxID=7108 RepID=A0A2H1WB65_SPOFR
MEIQMRTRPGLREDDAPSAWFGDQRQEHQRHGVRQHGRLSDSLRQVWRALATTCHGRHWHTNCQNTSELFERETSSRIT